MSLDLRWMYLYGMIAIIMVALFPRSVSAQSSNINETAATYIGDVTHAGTTMADLLLNQQETTSTRLWLINHYCDTLLQKRKDMWWENEMNVWYVDHQGYRYDPRQSLFMFVLCVGIDEKNNGKKIAGNDYKYRNYKEEFDTISYEWTIQAPKINDFLKDEWTSTYDFNEVRWLPDQSALDADDNDGEECDPSTTMQGCQFTEFAPRIFNAIMNDYSNLKLASIYGYSYGDTPEAIEKSIQDFANSYFGVDPEIDKDWPCNDSSIHYLWNKNLEWDKQHCAHPKTYSMVEQTLLSAQRLTQDTVLIDGKKLLESGECDDRYSTQNNLFRCALVSRGESFATTDMQTFENLLLNEMMYYHLFLSYYGGEIAWNPRYNPLTVGSFSFSAQRNEKEVGQIVREQYLSTQAIAHMRRLLAHVYTTYPVHVWLMAYMEDLLMYRSVLLRLRTPTNQLYYTWRNAQSCEAP